MSMLENDAVRLRALEPNDVDLLYVWENDMDVWRVSTTIAPISRKALADYIKHSGLDIYQAKQLRLVIEDKGDSLTSVGLIDLFNFDPFHRRAEVGLLVARQSDRHRGYATNALMLMEEYALGFLGLHQLYSNVASSNAVCLSLFAKLGYTEAGVKRDWRRTAQGWDDEVMLQRVKG